MLAARMPDVFTGPQWTGSASLPGGDFPRDAQSLLIGEIEREYPFLDHTEAVRIARAYGLDAMLWLGDATTRSDLGRNFGAGLSEAEVDYMRRVEFAQTAEDVLWRRSKLGLHMDEAERAAVAEYLAG